jgi:hypothetical protein
MCWAIGLARFNSLGLVSGGLRKQAAISFSPASIQIIDRGNHAPESVLFCGKAPCRNQSISLLPNNDNNLFVKKADGTEHCGISDRWWIFLV